jgi:hypothetical protein
LRTELLLLVPDDESFCSSKKAFVDFLKVNALIAISGQKISFRRTAKSKEVVSARFRVETDKVKSKQERYFLLTLECQDDALLDTSRQLPARPLHGFFHVNVQAQGRAACGASLGAQC